MSYTDVEKKQMAISSIKNYLNKDFTDDYIEQNFGLAISRIIDNFEDILSSSRNGISSITQGSQSITYDTGVETNQISDDIKLLLPKPYIKLF